MTSRQADALEATRARSRSLLQMRQQMMARRQQRAAAPVPSSSRNSSHRLRTTSACSVVSPTPRSPACEDMASDEAMLALQGKAPGGRPPRIRESARTARRVARVRSRQAMCPVCRIPVPADSMLRHVERCLNRTDPRLPEDSGDTGGRTRAQSTPVPPSGRSKALELQRRAADFRRKLTSTSAGAEK